MHAICEVLLDGDMRHPIQRILNFLSLWGSRQYPIGISRKILGNSAIEAPSNVFDILAATDWRIWGIDTRTKVFRTACGWPSPLVESRIRSR